MTRLLALPLVALLALGCRAPAADTDTASGPASGAESTGAMQPGTQPSIADTTVRIVLDRSAYRSRDDVRLTISNASQRNLGYNACTRTVERETNGAWTPVAEPDRVCTMELRLLGRGETATEQTDLPQLSRGQYRIAIRFSDESASATGPIRAVSAPFAVE